MQSKKIQWSILFAAAALFIYSLIHRRVDVDDAWIAEYAYWFSKLGYVKSEAMRGFAGAENKLFIYHKLFVAQGALLTLLFGFHAYVLKALSLVYFFPACYLLVQIYKKYSPSATKAYVILLLGVFVSFHHTMEQSFNFRPEMNLVFLGLLSFILLDKFLDQNKKMYWAFSAFFAGMAAANHLNGAIYIGAGVLLLWIYRKWWMGFFYGAIGSWGVFFYFFDVRSMEELKQLSYQFKNWRDVVAEHYTGLDQILRILNEHQRYFHSPAEIAYTLFIVVLIVTARKWIFPKGNRLLLYAALLTFLLAAIAHNTTSKYIIYSFPFFILLAIFGFEALMENKKSKIAIPILAVYLLTNWVVDIKSFSQSEVIQYTFNDISQKIPEGSNVLAPIEYIFAGIDHNQRVQATVNYEDADYRGEYKNLPQDFFAQIPQYNIDYIILSPELYTKFKVTGENYDNFRLDPALSLGGMKVFTKAQKQD